MPVATKTAAFCFASLGMALAARAQSLIPLYDLPQNPSPAPAHPLSISDDGSIVVGYEQDRVLQQRNYPRVWRRSTGFVADADPVPPANRYGQWYDASADGSVLVGTIGSQAYAWRADLGLVRLSIPGSVASSDAYAVSADGGTIGGDFYDNVALRALVWKFAGGTQPTPFAGDWTWVNALDEHGSLIVGGNDACGFVWSRPGAPVFTCSPPDSRVCNTITRSGAFVFGTQHGDMYEDPDAYATAFRWPSGEGPQDLGRFGNARWTFLLAAAESGDVAVGWASFGDYPETALAWTRDEGFLPLDAFLAGAGIDTTGWTFTSARDITPDGRYVIGEGVRAGRVCGFLAELPQSTCRADFNGDRVVDFFDYLDFVAVFDAEDAAADFNGDNAVDFFDYLDFAAAFDAGCDE
jgi:hypothetical protein